MLRTDEYAAIKADYDRISLENFEKSYVPPRGMSFAKSDALFPTGPLPGHMVNNVGCCVSDRFPPGTHCRPASKAYGMCCRQRINQRTMTLL